MHNVIEVNDLSRYFGDNNQITALDQVSLSIPKGSFSVILGRSGSGKSTLLNILAGLDKPSKGQVHVNGDNLEEYKSKDLARYRSKIGIIFQSYNLLPDLTVTENVLMGGWAAGNSDVNKSRVESILEQVGLSHRLDANIKTLSGGEKQRVAVARALSNKPDILFCDEPTGALDTANEAEIMEMLRDLNKKGITIVMVTHNPDFERLASQVIEMKDGKVDKLLNK